MTHNCWTCKLCASKASAVAVAIRRVCSIKQQAWLTCRVLDFSQPPEEGLQVCFTHKLPACNLIRLPLHVPVLVRDQ